MNPLVRALMVRIGRVDPMRLACGPLPRFLAVGVLGLVADTLVFTLLHDAGLSRAVARALSIAVATGVTWQLNRRFTFAATGRSQPMELSRYVTVTTIAQGISYFTFLTIGALVPTLPPAIAIFIGAVTATAFSFGGQRLFTFAARASQPLI